MILSALKTAVLWITLFCLSAAWSLQFQCMSLNWTQFVTPALVATGLTGIGVLMAAHSQPVRIEW